MPFCPNCGREVQGDNLFCPNCGRNLKQQQQQIPAPPQPSTAGGGYYGVVDPDASTARTLTLIAIILQGVFFVIGLFFSLFALAVPFIGLSIFALVFGLGFLISIIWIALDYFLVYRNLLSPNDIPRASTPALILGIVQLVFAGVIPGILLIIAYIKIGDSIRRKAQGYY